MLLNGRMKKMLYKVWSTTKEKMCMIWYKWKIIC